MVPSPSLNCLNLHIMRRLWNSGKCMHKVITLAPKLVVERGVSSSITSSAITPEPSEKNTELQTTDVTA